MKYMNRKYIAPSGRVCKSKGGASVLVLLCIALLAGCQSGAPQQATGLEDMELVVTAQQGRVQNLEKQVAEMQVKIGQLEDLLAENAEKTSGSGVDPSVISGLKADNEKLLKLVFQSMTDRVDKEDLADLAKSYDSVYKMNDSDKGTTSVLWVTGGGTSGDLYMLSNENGDLHSLGAFDSVTSVVWSPNGKMLIIETKTKNGHKGFLTVAGTGETLATFEYTGLPIWSRDSGFFVYLNENPNMVYTGTETAQMHSTGVYLYSFNTSQFSTIDTGGNDYLCQDLSVDETGEIKYVRMFKDGKQSFSSVKID